MTPTNKVESIEPNKAAQLVGISTEVAFRAGCSEQEVRREIEQSLRNTGRNQQEFWGNQSSSQR